MDLGVGRRLPTREAENDAERAVSKYMTVRETTRRVSLGVEGALSDHGHRTGVSSRDSDFEGGSLKTEAFGAAGNRIEGPGFQRKTPFVLAGRLPAPVWAGWGIFVPVSRQVLTARRHIDSISVYIF